MGPSALDQQPGLWFICYIYSRADCISYVPTPSVDPGGVGAAFFDQIDRATVRRIISAVPAKIRCRRAAVYRRDTLYSSM